MGSYKKKLFIALLVILLIGFFVCGSVNAAGMDDIYYNTDTTILLKNQQEYLANIFIRKSIKFEQNDFLNSFKAIYNNGYTYPIFTYFRSQYGGCYIACYFIPYSIDFGSLNTTLVNTNDEYFEDTYFLYPVSGYQFSASDINLNSITRYLVRIDSNSFTINNYTNNFFIPSNLIYYTNETVLNYINGVTPTDNVFLMLLDAINNNTEEVENATDEMKKLNDFMSSEDVDQDAYNYPTNNPTQDPTTDGINNIFNLFYNRITSWDSSSISVYIPFANKSFNIPANASEQLLAKFSNLGSGSTLKSLISAVWFYVLARYIIKDVQKYADGLKTGEILTKSDTNIKTEML